MYQVADQKFESFLAAVNVAKASGDDVIEVETGMRRWTPAPKVSAKKARRYLEQKAAYDAQQK